MDVAIKIQYPGVADSIESDIENVKLVLDYTNLIPKGLYLDRAMKVFVLFHSACISVLLHLYIYIYIYIIYSHSCMQNFIKEKDHRILDLKLRGTDPRCTSFRPLQSSCLVCFSIHLQSLEILPHPHSIIGALNLLSSSIC